jgi:ABC-type branched-subunit amino acid transport system ATPase component/ABC-type branched-subunit amino acid transport system permease subunit
MPGRASQSVTVIQSAWNRHRALAIIGLFVLALAVGWLVDDKAMSFGQMLTGAVYGSATGMLALGLILTYRSDRIINFAYGSMGGVSATLSALLFQFHHWNWLLAIIVGLASGIVLGALVEFTVIRRFTRASRLILTVATIGLAQILGGLQVLMPKWLGGFSLLGGLTNSLSAHTATIGTGLFNLNDLVVVLALPVVIIGLGWFLLRTDTGIAVRAIADNRDRAMLLGIPVRRLSLIVWMLAGLLAAVAVILPTPNGGLTIDAGAGPTLLLPALAAAVIAGMESLPVAVAAGIGLGVMDYLIRWNTSKQSVSTVGFFVIILVALLMNRKRISARDGADETSLAGGGLREIPEILRRLPEVRAFRVGGPMAVLAAAILIPLACSQSTINLFSITLIYGMVAVSLVVLTGWAGQVSLGQYAFVGLGACVVGDLMNHYNIDFFVCLVAGGLAGALLAVVVGLPALRIRGFYLAVTTMALAVTMDGFFLNPTNFNSLIPATITRPILWKRFNLLNERDLFYLCLGMLVLFILVVLGMRRARAGRAVIATRDNERAAAAMAVPTTRMKLLGFVLSGAIAGVAGGLHGTLLQAVGYHTYQPSESFLVFSMLIIGGADSISGALLGVVLIEWLVHTFPTYALVITGAGLLWILLILPGGLITAVYALRDRLLNVVARRRGIDLIQSAAGSVGVTPEVEAIPASTAVGPGSGMLSCSHVHAKYGAMQVLFGVDLEVADGEVVALLGTNGAGKSTMLKAVAGLLDAAPGKVWFDGNEITKWSPQQRVGAGLAMMPAKSIFPSLSVAENLRVAGWLAKNRPAELAASRAQVMDLFPQLAERVGQQSGTMSGGQQQMLSLALALLTKPKMLLIDELSLGLAPTVVARLLDVVRGLTAEGVTTVIVEQSVNVALEVAERAVFLERGSVRFSGQTADLLERSDVLRSVFITGTAPEPVKPRGRKALSPSTNGSSPNGAPPRELVDLLLQPTVLECSGINKSFGGIRVLNDIEFGLHKGEILGLIGHNGAGKTTLFDVVCGFLTPDGGRVRLGGYDITDLAASDRAVLGLGRSFQEARLFPALTVTETVAVACERHLMSKDLVAAALRLPASTISEAEVAERVEELLDQLGLTGYASAPIGELSTGTRRIVELACILAQEPAVVLLDEPTAGVAQKETEALGPLLRKVRDDVGCTMLVIDHDMPLLTALCDRLVALELGQVIAEGEPAAVLENPRVIESYLGVETATVERSGIRKPATKRTRKQPAAAKR